MTMNKKTLLNAIRNVKGEFAVLVTSDVLLISSGENGQTLTAFRAYSEWRKDLDYECGKNNRVWTNRTSFAK